MWEKLKMNSNLETGFKVEAARLTAGVYMEGEEPWII